jgi:hypothetical protein
MWIYLWKIHLKFTVSMTYIHVISYESCFNIFFLNFFTEVRGAASNSAYYGYPELWILRYPAQRYHAVPSPGFKPRTLWLRVRHTTTNHSATTIHLNKIIFLDKQRKCSIVLHCIFLPCVKCCTRTPTSKS